MPSYGLNKIIDSHQHFWNLDRVEYSWLTPDLSDLYRDYLPEDLQPLLKNSNVCGSVLVQAADNTNETEYLLELANSNSLILGVVGWVDMLSPDVKSILERYKRQSKFVGIRPMLQDLAEDNWMLKNELQPVYKCLTELDFTFDALVKPRHLDNLLQLLDINSNLRVVLNHCGKPDIKSKEYDNWAKKIAELAKHELLYCKLSGLVTEAEPFTGFNELIPYIDHVFDCFGADRVMWGSDWPVINLAGEYGKWLNNCLNYTSGFTHLEREQVFFSNVIKCYGLMV